MMGTLDLREEMPQTESISIEAVIELSLWS